MERADEHRVTILIPCSTGHRSFLPGCIQSCYPEGFDHPDAVIVVDDACRDPVDRMKVRPAAVIRIDERVGRSRARNIGLRQVQTPWVFFLDADDFLERTAILDFLSTVGSRRTDLLFADYDWIEGDVRTRVTKEFPSSATRARITLNPTNIGMFMKTERVLRIGGFDEDMEIGEYWDLWIKYVQNPRVLVTKNARPLFLARKNGSVRGEPQRLMDQATRKIQALIRGKYYWSYRGL